jgi:hypothetical protein
MAEQEKDMAVDEFMVALLVITRLSPSATPFIYILYLHGKDGWNG